jgi:hypothetical protein
MRLALHLAILILLVPAPAMAEAAHAVPPGQEELVAEMLGRGQPMGGCRLTQVDMKPASVEGAYQCQDDAGTVGIVLEYPSSGKRAAFTTHEFAVSTRDEPPAELLEGLRRRIIEREADWRWADVGDDHSRVEPNESPPQRARPFQTEASGRWWLAPAASCAAMLLVVAFGVARRARQRVP